MRKLLLSMLLSVNAAPSVQAGDRNDSPRDVLEICNQFIITDLDPPFASITLLYRRSKCPVALVRRIGIRDRGECIIPQLTSSRRCRYNHHN